MSDNENKIGRAAMKQLLDLNLPPSPNNYELFFRALEGKDPDLSREFKENYQSGRIVRIDVLEDMHHKYIGVARMTNAMLAIGDRLDASVERITGITRTVADEQDAFGGAMTSLHAMLLESNDPKKLLDAIAQIASVTSGMHRKTQVSKDVLESMAAQIEDLRSEIRVVQQDSLTDELTGVGNRRMFERLFAEAWDSARRDRSQLSVVMLDVDHFKAFNDTHGHLVGDRALKHIAHLIEENLGKKGTLCRYGGEEFAIVMPGIQNIDAMPIIEDIRRELARTHLVRKDSNEKIGSISASFGVAGLRAGETREDLLARADRNLYEAKSKGRNRIIGDPGADPTFAPMISRIQEAVRSTQSPAPAR